MKTSNFYIKNMFCERCIRMVENIFQQANFQIEKIQLGEVIAAHPNLSAAIPQVQSELLQMDFELVRSSEEVIVNKIKTAITKIVHQSDEVPKVNIAEYLSDTLNMPYKKLSTAFKEQQATTIEKFFILQKIERAKALLQYNELSIKEIAYKLGYCSLQHLSNQFKAETGISPRMYKATGLNMRLALDQVG